MKAKHYFFIYCDFCDRSSIMIEPGVIDFRPEDVIFHCPYCETTHWLDQDDHLSELLEKPSQYRHFFATRCPQCSAPLFAWANSSTTSPAPFYRKCPCRHRVLLTRDQAFMTLPLSELRWSKFHQARRLTLRLQDPLLPLY